MTTVAIQKEGESLKIQIQNKCTILIKIILLIILIPCTLIPVVGIVLMANSGNLNFGIIMGACVFYAIIVYPFLKITIWQFYGQEIFTIYHDKITYEACFKFLKNQFDEIKTSRPEILFSDRELEKDERIGTLVFLHEENKLKSALKINEADYQELLKKYRTETEKTR